MADTPPRCHCGRPLHYNDPNVKRQVDALVAELGEMIPVALPDGRTFNVSRHYIALHGLRAEELPSLGFEEIRKH
jgi:hypothetical protein